VTTTRLHPEAGASASPGGAPPAAPEGRAPARPPAAPGLGERTFGSLRHRGYRLLWLSMLASFLGNQMNMVARGWLAFQLTGEASAIGIVMVAWGLPMAVLALFGGVVADRYNKRRTLLGTQSAQGLMGLVIAIVLFADRLEMWHLVAAGFLQGTMFAFMGPTRQALLPLLVGKQQLGNAIALNNAAMNLTRILGPTLAGVMLGSVGAEWVYVTMAAAFAIVVLLIWRLPDPERTVEHRAARAAQGSVMHEMGVGLRYVFRDNRLLAWLIALGMVPVILGFPYQMLLPVFQEVVFEVEPWGLGLMYGVGGVGALAGSLFVAAQADHPRAPMLQIGAGIAFGATLAAFAWAPGFWVALPLLVAVGLFSMIFMSLNNTLVLGASEPAYHGRVMSIYMLTFSLVLLGAVPMTLATDAFGAPATPTVAGIAIAAFIVLMARPMLGAAQRSRGRGTARATA
jgi:MFS family permease